MLYCVFFIRSFKLLFIAIHLFNIDKALHCNKGCIQKVLHATKIFRLIKCWLVSDLSPIVTVLLLCSKKAPAKFLFKLIAAPPNIHFLHKHHCLNRLVVENYRTTTRFLKKDHKKRGFTNAIDIIILNMIP